ncbi:peptidoglycan DD-metalloendopeptidase family protein [Planomicrobium sp. CPCC 101079]|uniref:peptidoglycan DD-metalloendopeptidase family protein n=1 Tax=Planomicrobium sp. CPCC 101079 TaxID=2599618 RepID=UPI0011B4418E|nr:peptidoglycan DD-metalloendopeptidase family protein [Planomicrobium sp. CPCC 101079]TWT04600.1 peptidoglycan DD-metalloendopeptidase family protein [Planomicrobium sp. CPCC 101079]
MATVGKSNIEITADTSKARRSLGDFFRQAENTGRQFARVLNTLDPLSSIESDANNASQTFDRFRDSVRRLESDLSDVGDNNLNDLTSDLSNAEQNMNDLQQETNDLSDELDNASDATRGFGDTAVRETGNAESSFGKFIKVAKTLGGVLVAAFAIDKIKDIGTELAATAGSANAMTAQFSSVFGDMEKEASKRLGAIADEAGILENRMKESFTGIAAFAKTGGMDTADSLDLADRSMRAVADSAAFYDRSLEDTTESLQSFLKGNYENDAALGLSATETTRNSAAIDNFGKKFNELSEAQKQLTLLDMVEDANKVSGAMGQAARESEGWENVTGNLSQAWTDFKAKIGAPVLEVATAGILGMTKAITTFPTDIIKNGLGGALDFVRGAADRLKTGLEPLKETFKGIMGLFKDDGQKGRDILKGMGFSEETIMMLDGYAAKIAEFRYKLSDFIKGIKGLFQDDGQKGRDILASLGFSPDLIAVMDEWAMNLSAFRGNVQDVLGAFAQMFSGDSKGGADILTKLGFSERFVSQATAVIGTVSKIGNSIRETLIALWPHVQAAVSAIVSFLVTHFSKIISFWAENGPQFLKAVSNIFSGIMKVVNFVMPFVLAIIRSVWGNIKGVITGALDIIMGVVKIFSGLFTGDFAKMWEGLKQLFKGAVTFLWNFVQLTFYGKILGGAKAFILAFKGGFASLWSGLKSLFTGNISSMVSSFKNGWSMISGATKTAFSGIWNFLKNTYNSIKSITTGLISGAKTIFTTGWQSIKTNTVTKFGEIFNSIKQTFGNIRSNLSDSASSILTKLRDTWSSLKTNTTGAFRDIYNGIKTRFSDIVNAAKSLPGRIGDGIGSMASKVTSGVTKVINKLASTLGKGINGVIGGVNWVLGKIGVDKDIPKWTIPQYHQGTPGRKGHPGGLAMVNDGKGANAGPELIQNPDGSTYMLKGKNVISDFQKGTHVWSAKETKAILANIPKYASGTIGKAKEAATHLWGKVKSGGKKVLETAIDVFDYIKNPSKLLDVALKTLGVEKPSGTSFVANMAKGAWDKVKSSAVNLVKGKLNEFGDDGGPAPGFGPLFGKSSSYGWRMHPILKKRVFHNGADYPAPAGALIKAQAAGRVIQSAYHALRGNYVRIKSGIMERIYQHNTRNLVGVGDMVKKGQGIGTVGSTGRSTGPHLHYEVLKNGKNINPEGFFKGGIVKAKQLAWVAEKGMEAIIPLVTHRAEGLNLWKQVGEHFGFNMDALLNPTAHEVNFAGGMGTSSSLSTVGQRIAMGSSSNAEPVIHNHYWNVNADEINDVVKLKKMVTDLGMSVKQGV